MLAWWFFDFARRMAGAGAGANGGGHGGLLLFLQFSATAIPAGASLALFVSYARRYRND